MSKFIVENWKNLVAIIAVVWSGFCFVYVLQGLPNRVTRLEEMVKEYQMEKIPPRVTNLEGDVKSLEKEIYTMKADLRENYTMTLNSYQLIKEIRDYIFLKGFENVYQK